MQSTVTFYVVFIICSQKKVSIKNKNVKKETSKNQDYFLRIHDRINSQILIN